MSGRLQERLEGFVKRDDQRKSTQTPPPSTEPQPQRHGRQDRAAAATVFKIRRGEKAIVNPLPAQTLPRTLSTPGYDSNPAAVHNTYPNPRYQLQQHRSVQDVEPNTGYMVPPEQHLSTQAGAFDDTLASTLEDTKSDILYNGAAIDKRGRGLVDLNEYDLQAEEGYIQQGPRHQVRTHGHASKPPAQHGLQHKQSRSPLIDVGAEQQQHRYAGQPTNSISRRFENVADEHWQQDIAHRSSNEPARHANGSNQQQGYSEELGHDDGGRAAYGEQQSMGRPESDDYDDESGDEEEASLPAQQGRGGGHRMQQEVGYNHVEPHTDGLESVVSTVGRRYALRNEVDRALMARTEDPNWYKVVFDDKKLQSMAYSDLKKETWDSIASSQKRANPVGTQHCDFTLEDCIKYMVEDETADAQVRFFEEMSIAEYDESGDFFIDKFADLMKQIKDARKKKRALVTAFEKEIEERENAIRGKCESLDKQFNDMRAGGESVLRGKV